MSAAAPLRAPRASAPLSAPVPAPPRPTTARPAPPRLRVVQAPRQARTRVPFVALCMGVLVVSLLAVLLLNTRMAQGEYSRYALQTRLAQSAQNQQVVATELDRAASPANLAIAARRLGMVPSPGGAYLRLADGAVLGDPVPAKARG